MSVSACPLLAQLNRMRKLTQIKFDYFLILFIPEFGEAIAGVLAIALAVALLPFCVWVVKSCSGGSEEDGEDEKCFAKSETEMMGFETMEELPWHRLPESGRLLESGRLQESIRK